MAASGVSGTAAAPAVPAGDTEPTEPEIDQVLGERAVYWDNLGKAH